MKNSFLKLIKSFVFLFSLSFLVFLFRKEILFLFWNLYPERNRFFETQYQYESIEDTEILMQEQNTPIIPVGKQGESDETIREIGNIIFDEKRKRYLIYYTGHSGKANLNNNVFIHVASSTNLKDWTKHGKVLETSSEDPFVVLKDDLFFMFYEDKSEVPFKNINVAISREGLSFFEENVILRPSKKPSWDDVDVSSPVVVFNQKENKWVMLYEGRSNENRGAIGYAESTDLLKWEKRETPVFEGSKTILLSMYRNSDNFLVPDDIFFDGEKYIFTYHGVGHRRFWQSFIASSPDLLSWQRSKEFPLSANYTVMFFDPLEKRFMLMKENGIFIMKGLEASAVEDFEFGKQLY